jgi:hypothetical protein
MFEWRRQGSLFEEVTARGDNHWFNLATKFRTIALTASEMDALSEAWRLWREQQVKIVSAIPAQEGDANG